MLLCRINWDFHTLDLSIQNAYYKPYTTKINLKQWYMNLAKCLERKCIGFLSFEIPIYCHYCFWTFRCTPGLHAAPLSLSVTFRLQMKPCHITIRLTFEWGILITRANNTKVNFDKSFIFICGPLPIWVVQDS